MNRPAQVALTLLAVCLLMFGIINLTTSVRRNLTWFVFLHAMSDESALSSQSAALSRLVRMWDRSPPVTPVPGSDEMGVASKLPASQALLIGEHFRARNEQDQARSWYAAAGRDKNLAYSIYALGGWRMHLDTTGAIMLDAPDRGHEGVMIDEDGIAQRFEENGVTHVRINRRPYVRDRVALSFFPNPTGMPLIHHRILEMSVRTGVGAYFTLESVEDGQRIRHISYQPGDGQWQVLRIPLQGKVLKEVKLIFNEPDSQDNGATPVDFWLDSMRVVPVPYTSLDLRDDS